MKVFYTKSFRNDLKNETKNLYLSYYGLRYGEFKKNLDEESVLTIKQSSPIIGYYVAQGLDFLDSGVQLSIDVPSTDNSFYYAENGVGKEMSYYQLIIFYYTDLTSPISDNIQIAFILFENFNKENLDFEGLNLITRKNIITIPSLPDKKCALTFTQSDLTEFLEGETLHTKTLFKGGANSYAAREYVEKKLDESYREDPGGKAKYYRTSLINKYGLKLY